MSSMNIKATLVSDWLWLLQTRSDVLRKTLINIYGERKSDFYSYKAAELTRLLDRFAERFGDEKVCLLRVPGRINLMGRHVEHRGSCINSLAIDKETLVAASERPDGLFSITNCRDEFGDYTFDIEPLIRQSEGQTWSEFLDSEYAADIVERTKGEWLNYVRAPLLRLKFEFPDMRLKGMNLCYHGDIPVAAGLSSSSSIVVASLLSQTIISGFDLSDDDFVRLCGEGEWFVGSRGGWGDHAAMKCCLRGMITRFDFLPFGIGPSEYFPEEYCVVFANTFIQAKKSDGAKDKFNMKIACYEFGFMLMKKYYPQYRDRLGCLRDFNCEHLGINESDLYRMLCSLPERISPEELIKMLPEYKEEIYTVLKTHTPPEYYDIRKTVFYGLAESARASLFLNLLRQKKLNEIGRLMNISHDGDRINKSGVAFNGEVSDGYLMQLLHSMSESVGIGRTHIAYQPGGYGCSTSEIDDLVDYIAMQDGVLGCELSGAGLGGSVLALVERNKAAGLLSKLKTYYYDQKGLPMGAEVVTPSQGCCTIDYPS
mgnify:CR=1 FL=1